MKYYIFRVKDSNNQEYYVVNNQYIGYLGFDSHPIRPIIEQKVTRKYQLIASKNLEGNDSNVFYRLFCDNARLTMKEVDTYITNYKFKRSNDKVWYEIYYPDKNSSECYLREIPNKSNKLKEIK